MSSSSSKTISVSSPEGLASALRAAQSGDTIELKGGSYGALELWGERDTFALYAGEVTIRSADAADPARFSSMALNGAKNMTFDGIVFDYVSKAQSWDKYKPFEVKSAENITIRNSVFDGDVAKMASVSLDGYGTGHGLTVGGSTNILIENNLFFDWARAASFGGVQDLEVTGNEVRGIRSDGFNFVGVRDAVIAENHLHSFERSPTAGDHADMIQFWTLNTSIPSRNVVIEGNILDSAGMPGTQSIFMRNEQVDLGRAGSEMFYENIRIIDNLIRNAHTHGITLGETQGVEIRGNTLIHDADAGDRGGVTEPGISVARASRDVVIADNIAHRIPAGEPDWQVSNNLVIQRLSPNLPDFYDALFINARADGLGGVEALRALPGGVIDQRGLGAEATRFDVTPDALDGFILAAQGGRPGLENRSFEVALYGPRGRIDLTGAAITWDFGDGTAKVSGGAKIAHSFPKSGDYLVEARVALPDGRSVQLRRAEDVVTSVALDVDFAGSAADLSAPDAPTPEIARAEFLAPGGRPSVRLDGGFIRWPPKPIMRNTGGFVVDVVFARRTAADRGMLLSYPGVFSIAVGRDHVTASIGTSVGGGRIRSQRGAPAGRWMSARLAFSGDAGVAALYLDGVEVGRVDGLIGGVTGGEAQNLVLGDLRGDSFSGYVDRLRFEVTR